MGLVQKIFYYHVPVGDGDVPRGVRLRHRQRRLPVQEATEAADRLAAAAAELAVVFGLIVLVTGPLWARKAWGVWWQWDARLTSTLLMWMIFVAYLLVRRFGGPGAEKLAAAMAVFGMANVPFVYISVNIWRTIHPTTRVVPTLPGGMRGPFWFCAARVHAAVRPAAGAPREARAAAGRGGAAVPAGGRGVAQEWQCHAKNATTCRMRGRSAGGPGDRAACAMLRAARGAQPAPAGAARRAGAAGRVRPGEGPAAAGAAARPRRCVMAAYALRLGGAAGLRLDDLAAADEGRAGDARPRGDGSVAHEDSGQCRGSRVIWPRVTGQLSIARSITVGRWAPGTSSTSRPRCSSGW